MQELRLDRVVENIAEALRDENFDLAQELLYPALDQKPEVAPLWFYAGILQSIQGHQAVAFECFRKSQELEPHPANWSNMGGVLRTLGRVEECRALLLQGLEHTGAESEILANLSGSYVNEGEPNKGIEYGERALALNPKHLGARFNLSLLYLEAGRYAEGFDNYAEGAHRHRLEKHYEPDPPFLTPALHEDLRGKGQKIIVYGEQGIGDEIMFSTIMRDVRRDYEVIFDCHPRLETLYQHASWMKSAGHSITLHPTRKIAADKLGWSHDAVAKLPIGNLGRLYRRELESFTWHGPVLHPNPKEVRQMRTQLERVAAGRKIIGLALHGGTMQTARLYRMLPPGVLHQILSDPRYLFVSLDYEDMTKVGEFISEKYGAGRFLWYPSVCWAWDYGHQAALVKATDALVTVCQSIAHVSAAMGHPTYVMTPSKPAWRYGTVGERWHWYGHTNARLLRQVADDWRPPSTELAKSLEARFFSERAA